VPLQIVGHRTLDDLATRATRATRLTAPVARYADDTAVILYTSGTTGTPKGAELTHTNMVLNARVSAQLFSLNESDAFLGALPLFHSFGQTCAMNASISAGASLVLLPRFDPGAALALIEHENISVFAGVPTMYGAMLESPAREQYSHASLRLCASGGSSLPVELLRRFEAAFGCAILEGYGLSRDLTGGIVQPPQPRTKGRYDWHADCGRRNAPRRYRRPAREAG